MSKKILKKISFITPLLLISLLVVGCEKSSNKIETNNNVNANNINKSVKQLDLEKITNNVKDTISTIQETKIYTEDNDPNKNLGKAGYYIQGAAFWDTRTEYSEDYSQEKGMWGTEAGGSIEVYSSSEDAKKRIDYLNAFTGTVLDAGAAEQINNIVIRASSKLKKSEQDAFLTILKKEVNN